jgi:cation diffusion facilitator CzcD-associated flavoprotein CzcO
MARTVKVAIVGGGIGGITAAIALRREGIDDVVLLERGDRVGGTWRANTYPGLACDVPSHLYSFSFAPNPGWSRRFSPGAEIREYVEGVAQRFGVLEKVRFGAEVERATWDDAAGCWQVELAGGERIEADALVTACGQLSRPVVPSIAGMERFTGPMFHSAHWDHGCGLAGQRVACIGTGASAIQIVPAVADQAAQVTVFQRSAPWALTKPDREYPERARRLHARRPYVLRLWREGWRLQMESLVPLFTGRPRWAAALLRRFYAAVSRANRFAQLRGNLALYRATRPGHPIGCKRILITSDWYPTLRRKHVDLVNAPIREIAADGVVTADGRLHAADAIVFGTGFATTEFLAPMEVVGRDGLTLTEAWASGAEAYLGIAVKGFPNLFLMYGPNTNHGTGSVISMHEAQAAYATQGIRALADERAERLEVREDRHDAFQAELAERLRDTAWTSCSSWYVTAEGRITNNWPGSQREYHRRVRRFQLGDYVTRAPAPVVSEPAAASADA